MALSLTVTDFKAVAGRIYVRFSDGAELEFKNVSEAKEFVNGVDDDAARDLLRRMILRFWVAKDPTNNPANLIGKTITVDFSAATLVRVV